MDELYSREGYELVGAAMEVYNIRGHGFHEEVYQECLEIELSLRGIPFESQPELKLSYKEHELRRRYQPDMYVHGGMVVELKAIKELTSSDEAQLLNYLKGTGKRVGYLLNFGHVDGLEWKRFVL